METPTYTSSTQQQDVVRRCIAFCQSVQGRCVKAHAPPVPVLNVVLCTAAVLDAHDPTWCKQDDYDADTQNGMNRNERKYEVMITYPY